MDLQQRKLTKSEWDSIEMPLPKEEVEVLELIVNGYDNVEIKYNKRLNILGFLKMKSSQELEDYVFSRYLLPVWLSIKDKYDLPTISSIDKYSGAWGSKYTFKKALTIRLNRYTCESMAKEDLLENTMFSLITELVKLKYGGKKYTKINKTEYDTTLPEHGWEFPYVTLTKLLDIGLKANVHVASIVKALVEHIQPELKLMHVIQHSAKYIEQNKITLQYADMCLFEHQKKIFQQVKTPHPKLIMYTAPTGTGKTLTPIGILGGHKVIFVCAARHVGLALAKAALNVHKKVAFAFGCETPDDIRLHYFAAKDYTKDWRSGGIRKVDNSVGDKVELIICDVKSYLPAMYYMMAFNDVNDMVTYWDEPTITLDYETHHCHEIIQKNWSNNLIPNMVLSSATLPKRHELRDTIADFTSKFLDPDTSVIDIVSNDCRKSVPIVNRYGFVVSPHNVSSEYENMKKFVEHCENNPVLMRYFDLGDISNAIVVANQQGATKRPIERYFGSLDDITMVEIKKYYLVMLKFIPVDKWTEFYLQCYSTRQNALIQDASQNTELRKVKSFDPTCSRNNQASVFTNSMTIPSNANKPITRMVSATEPTKPAPVLGTYISTKDSHTLTDGPTIYLSDEPEKIAKFCIQQANIPEVIMNDLLKSIDYNNKLNDKIDKLERELEDALPKESNDSKTSGDKKKTSKSNTEKIDRALSNNSLAARLKENLDVCRKMIKSTRLNETFVPNKSAHINKWASDKETTNAFTSSIEESTIVDIMTLSEVSNSWKVLLMLGIGVFTNHKSIEYTEIMKQLADQQRLYLIIASSDYIYGTNYQFCHGYISKDMELSQEKIIQAIGRVGRNGIQQKYTIRFRNDEPILKLFTHEENKPEVINMNRLFNSSVLV